MSDPKVEPVKPEPKKAPAKFRVKAVAHGYFNNRRIKPGEVFEVTEEQFSDANAHKEYRRDGALIVKRRRGWMLKVGETEKPFKGGSNRNLSAAEKGVSGLVPPGQRPSDESIA